MIPKHRVPTHPGVILLDEFLRPLGISQVRFARHLGIPLQRVNQVVRGKRGVTERKMFGGKGWTPKRSPPLTEIVL